MPIHLDLHKTQHCTIRPSREREREGERERRGEEPIQIQINVERQLTAGHPLLFGVELAGQRPFELLEPSLSDELGLTRPKHLEPNFKNGSSYVGSQRLVLVPSAATVYAHQLHALPALEDCRCTSPDFVLCWLGHGA